jgi:hypothetical protein
MKEMLSGLEYFLPTDKQDIKRAEFSFTNQSVREMLDYTLSYALKFKIQTMLSSQRFKFIFFKSGTKFKAATMQCRLTQSRNTSPEGDNIKLCLRPAVFYDLTAAEGQTRDDLFGLPEMPSSGCITEAAIDEVESLLLYSQALVLV